MRKYVNLYFTTCTILNWNNLLHDDDYKNIIINSFQFLVDQQKATIWAFVIMPNHIHFIWQILEPNTIQKIQLSLLRFTSKEFKSKLVADDKLDILQQFQVDKSDRKYQFWQRNSLSIEIYSDKILIQKANYIHNNPTQKGFGINYKYSSRSYFETAERSWPFLFSWND